MAAFQEGRVAMTDKNKTLDWHRVADIDDLPEGRVKTVTAGIHSMALTHIDGELREPATECEKQSSAILRETIRIQHSVFVG